LTAEELFKKHSSTLTLVQNGKTLKKIKGRKNKVQHQALGLTYWVMETAIIVAATAAAADTDSTEPDDGEHTVAHVRGVHVPDEADKRAAYWLTRALM